jgi:CDP-4-dehydro-6-deoxyglucose reductase
MFLALALVKPILSQGGEADMSVVPTNIDFDWFELPVLALVYVINPMHLWYWVLGLTALLFLMPWLPPKRLGSARAQNSITFHPDHKAISARFGETLLDAGLRQDIDLPYECRNGGCGVCKCTVLQGKVDPGLYQPSALSAAELAQGKVLLCCATRPRRRRDRVPGEHGAENSPGVQRPRRRHGEAHRRRHARPAQAAGRAADPFKAGQYINIILEDGQRRAFSFANPPHEAEFVELQIRLMPGGRFTTHVFEAMKEGDEVRFEGPIGDFTLRESERPIVFVAGATGFAPVKSMVEDAFSAGSSARSISTGACAASRTCTCPNCRNSGRASTKTSTSFRSSPIRRPRTPGAAAPAWSMKRFSKTSRNSRNTKSTPAARCAWSRRSSPSSRSTAPKTAPASRMPSASRRGRWPSSQWQDRRGRRETARVAG